MYTNEECGRHILLEEVDSENSRIRYFSDNKKKCQREIRNALEYRSIAFEELDKLEEDCKPETIDKEWVKGLLKRIRRVSFLE